MEKNTYVLGIATISGILLSIGIIYLQRKSPVLPPFIVTTRITKKTIRQTVAASGCINIKNPVKIGSMISGIVKELYVKENEQVTAGKLLLAVDPGTGTTDYEQAHNEYLKAEKEYHYRKIHFGRKAILYQGKQIAQDEYDHIEKDTLVAEYAWKASKARLEREKLLLSNRNIYAPSDGFVIKLNTTKGSGVIGSSVAASEPLMEIAPNFNVMDVKVNVDESDIGLIKPDQKMKITINGYPDQPVYTTINDIGFSAKKIDGIQFYTVGADLDNTHKKFRPGMFCNAKIYIAKKEHAPCLEGFSFQIDEKNVSKLATLLGYSCKPLDKKQRKKIKQDNPDKRIKFVWIRKHKSFIQKAVTIGITDDHHFEILDGLNDHDQVIIDIADPGVASPNANRFNWLLSL